MGALSTLALVLTPILSYYLFFSTSKAAPKPKIDDSALSSVLIPAYTSHQRTLPVPSKHTFYYPLLYVGVDIDSLEAGSLDLPFNLLTYGGSPFSKVLGIRSDNYLAIGNGSLREKADALLKDQGVENVGRVWLVTMPSFVGFEGINPLSVWYCYSRLEGKGLVCVILEVHNTFGEKHAYVLPITSSHVHAPAEGYTHGLTFPRSFHVSPFNSRSGYYRLDLLDPFISPTESTPAIKVSLRLLTPDREPKLHAVLSSKPTSPSIPILATNISRISQTILRFPFALLLSTPRILYQAYILHYTKKLAVYPRPEPGIAGAENWNEPQRDEEGLGVALGLKAPSWAERKSRDIVLAWAEGRAEDTGIDLEIVFRDGRDSVNIGSSHEDKLSISTASPKLFSSLISTPSAKHFRLLAPELLTSISSDDLFDRFFSPPSSRHPTTFLSLAATNIRKRHLLFLMSCSHIAPPPNLLLLPTPPCVDGTSLTILAIVAVPYLADMFEEWIMWKLGATFVEGQEPWGTWERAIKRLYKIREAKANEGLGSTRYVD
ncbi:uncharacterized protein P7C73_g4398, partial [Tremellales sp. Uapishka_1]